MKKNIIPILIVILIITGGASLYFYKKVSKLQSPSDSISTEEIDKIVLKLKGLILLPEGEVPTIATVSDVSKLKDQPFFAKAKEGDMVVMYPKARKAYLYDPVNNKILEVAPITLNTQPDPATINNVDSTVKPKETNTKSVETTP